MTATQDWSDVSLLSLFRLEVETQTAVLTEQLLVLEKSEEHSETPKRETLEALMRASHSIKGAARIVQIEVAVSIAHALEDCFLLAQNGQISLTSEAVDVLLLGVDLLSRLSLLDESALQSELEGHEADAERIVQAIAKITSKVTSSPAPESSENDAIESPAAPTQAESQPDNQAAAVLETNAQAMTQPTGLSASGTASTSATSPGTTSAEGSTPQRMIRISAENLNRLMGLAGESLVESNWIEPFADSLLQLKRKQQQVMQLLEQQQHSLAGEGARASSMASSMGSSSPLSTNSSTVTAATNHTNITAQLQDLDLSEAIAHLQECHTLLTHQLGELDVFSRRFSQLSDRLYREVIASHMCAFEESARGYSRLVRDLAKSQGKQVKLTIQGLTTQIDRDILAKLEAPITHLITNAIAHGIESPEARLAAGKPAKGTITITALHRSGMLVVTVADDGAGINLSRIRKIVVGKALTTDEVVNELTVPELLEFLFLPGFSTAPQVDKIAGRGYGLDLARAMAQSVGGSLQLTSKQNSGTEFQFQLPLTLSVVRSLLFEIDREPYAIALSRIHRVMQLSSDDIHISQGRPYFVLEETVLDETVQRRAAVERTTRSPEQSIEYDSKQTAESMPKQTGSADRRTRSDVVSLVSAAQLLDLSGQSPNIFSGGSATINETHSAAIPVVVIGEPGNRYGLCVDCLIEERDLVVRPLDVRLGKVPNITAAALTEQGEPILILDVADVIRSAETLVTSSTGKVNSEGPAKEVDNQQGAGRSHKRTHPSPETKHILVVDDSMTVRAMEKKLLNNHGYKVDVAVNGMEGWNAVRMTPYDLVITDVDMPRMNGIALIEHMRAYRSTQKIPVIVVSYKDHADDQLAGLNAGANYYLTKSSFHDDGLINAVVDLVGPAR